MGYFDSLYSDEENKKKKPSQVAATEQKTTQAGYFNDLYKASPIPSVKSPAPIKQTKAPEVKQSQGNSFQQALKSIGDAVTNAIKGLSGQNQAEASTQQTPQEQLNMVKNATEAPVKQTKGPLNSAAPAFANVGNLIDQLGKQFTEGFQSLAKGGLVNKAYAPAKETQKGNLKELVKQNEQNQSLTEKINKDLGLGIVGTIEGGSANILKGNAQPKKLDEKIAYGVGQTLGSVATLRAITGQLTKFTQGSKTIGQFVDKYPKVAKYVVPFATNILGFDIYGQLDPDTKSRLEKFAQDTATGALFSTVGGIKKGVISIPAQFATGYALAKAAGANNEDAFISGGILSVLDASHRAKGIVAPQKAPSGSVVITPEQARTQVEATDLNGTAAGDHLLEAAKQAEAQGKHIEINIETNGKPKGQKTPTGIGFDTALVEPQQLKLLDEEGQPTETQGKTIEQKKNQPVSNIKAPDEELITKYREQFKDHLLLNTDNVREMYKPEGYNRINSAEFHDRANKLSNEIFQQDLKTLKEGDTYLFTAGSSGSGKSSSLEKNPRILTDIKAGLDGNFSSDSSLKKLDAVIKTGAKPRIAFFYREPLDAWDNGVVKRAIDPNNRRVVPLDIFIENLEGSPKKVLEAYAKYGDKVDIRVIDNSHGSGKAREVNNPIDFLRKLNYNIADVKQQIIKSTEEKIKAGTINETTGKALLGNGSSGQSEQERTSKQTTTVEPPKEKSQHTNPSKEEPIGTGATKNSRLFERVKETLGVEYENQNRKYNTLDLEQQANKVAKLIEDQPEQAVRIARAQEEPPQGITQNAVAVGLAEVARAKGDYKTAAEIWTDTSLRSTRLGQEIVSLRGNMGQENPLNAVKKVVNYRIDKITKQYKNIIKSLNLPEGTGSVKQVDAVIKAQTARAKQYITARQRKISSAQDIINALTCK